MAINQKKRQQQLQKKNAKRKAKVTRLKQKELNKETKVRQEDTIREQAALMDHELQSFQHFLQKQRFSEAEQQAVQLVQKFPEHPLALQAMGLFLAAVGRYDDSSVYFARCVEIAPDFIDAWYNRSITSAKMGKMNRAIEYLRKTIALKETDPELGEKAERILNEYEEQIKKDTGLDTDTFIAAGNLFEEASQTMVKRDFKEAAEQFQKVLEIHPKNAPSLANLGLCLAQEGNLQEGIEYQDKALAIDPNYEVAKKNKDLFEKHQKAEATKQQEEKQDLQEETTEPAENPEQ